MSKKPVGASASEEEIKKLTPPHSKQPSFMPAAEIKFTSSYKPLLNKSWETALDSAAAIWSIPLMSSATFDGEFEGLMSNPTRARLYKSFKPLFSQDKHKHKSTLRKVFEKSGKHAQTIVEKLFFYQEESIYPGESLAFQTLVETNKKPFLECMESQLNKEEKENLGVLGFIRAYPQFFLDHYSGIHLNRNGFFSLVNIFKKLDEIKNQYKNELHQYKDKSIPAEILAKTKAVDKLLSKKVEILHAVFVNSLTTWNPWNSQLNDADKKAILSYLIAQGLHLNFIDKLCDPVQSGADQYEKECHQLLLELLLHSPSDYKPNTPLWRSAVFMADIFSGINPASPRHTAPIIRRRLNIDAQNEKLQKMIAVFTGKLPTDFSVIPPAFSYLSVCLLKQKELFPQADIKPHLTKLLDIIGRKQAPCVAFARAILTAPFNSSKADVLKRKLRAEFAVLLPPMLRDVINQLVIEKPKLEAKREMEQPVEQVVDLPEKKEISEPASQPIVRSSLSSPVGVSAGPTHLPSPISSAPSLFRQARPSVSLSTELRQKLQERTVVSDPPSEALLEVKQSLPLSSAPTEDSDEKLRTQLYEIIRTQADKTQSDKLDCKALRRYADQAQKKGLFSEALELQVFEHEAQREELLTALDQDLKEVPDSGALTPHQEVLTALRTVQQSLKETVNKIQALHKKEQKSYAPSTAASVHQFTDAQWEKIELFKKALELTLSDHFVQHIAVARKLAKAKLNKPTQLIVGGVAFAVGQLLPVPLVGTVVSEGVNWVIQRYKRAESSELSFGMSSVSEAALLIENIVALTACSYQLMISRLHPLAIEVFASSLVKRMAQCPPLEGVSADEKLAQHLVMYCSTHETVDDSLYSLAEDSQVVAFHSKGSYCYVTVNDICRNSGMLDFDMERQRYYHWPSSAPAFQGLPRYVSTYERTARKLERSTVWQNHLPISPLSLQNSQLLEKIKRLESQLRRSHAQCAVWQEENRRLGEGGRRSTGPGLFDSSSSAGINTQACAATVNIR